VLYATQPADATIWKVTQDPVNASILAIKLLPFFGVNVLIFAYLFANIDRKDEYQLVQFILMFKGCQFLSSGVCMSAYVAVKYFLCVHPDGYHTCQTDGPAAAKNEISAIIDIFGSCILVWFVFWILPRSTRSSGLRDIAKREDPDGSDAEEKAIEGQEGCCKCAYDEHRGGRMTVLLRYDLVCFILSLLFFCLLSLIQVSHVKPGEQRETDHEKIKADLQEYYFTYEFRITLYWTRIFYSILSAPFFLFYLPVLNGILTHTTPTGYNRYGMCVPFMMYPDEVPPDGPEEDNKEV